MPKRGKQSPGERHDVCQKWVLTGGSKSSEHTREWLKYSINSPSGVNRKERIQVGSSVS